MYSYQAIITRVIDGDTIVADVDLGFNIWMKDSHIRLVGINAPETRTRDLEEKARGIAAKDRLTELLDKYGPKFVVKTSLDKQWGSFKRVLGEVWVVLIDEPDNTEMMNINEQLVAEGHAARDIR